MSLKTAIQHYPVTAFFVLTFTISWGGSLLVAGPEFFRGEALPLTDYALMFMVMLAGPSVSGLTLTAVTSGRSGLRELFARMQHRDVATRWYASALLLPPLLILLVLISLSALDSSIYFPALTLTGLAYGLLAGYFEEIGWTGYAYPRMQHKYSPLKAALILGLLWGIWHTAPGYLGASESLGVYWPLNFLTLWIGALTAIRVLIVWLYRNTQSVWMAQLMHAGFTGFLAMLAPVHIPPAKETLWYGIYAGVLWLVAALVIVRYGTSLKEQEHIPQDAH